MKKKIIAGIVTFIIAYLFFAGIVVLCNGTLKEILLVPLLMISAGVTSTSIIGLIVLIWEWAGK